MPAPLAVVLGLVLGALSGFISGFLLSIAVLSSLRLANRARVRRGETAYKNESRPHLEKLFFAVGALAGGVTAPLFGLAWAAAYGALAPAGFYLVVFTVSAVGLAVSDRLFPPKTPTHHVDGGPRATVPSRTNKETTP